VEKVGKKTKLNTGEGKRKVDEDDDEFEADAGQLSDEDIDDDGTIIVSHCPR
jgi:hypothetical protein